MSIRPMEVDLRSQLGKLQQPPQGAPGPAVKAGGQGTFTMMPPTTPQAPSANPGGRPANAVEAVKPGSAPTITGMSMSSVGGAAGKSAAAGPVAAGGARAAAPATGNPAPAPAAGPGNDLNAAVRSAAMAGLTKGPYDENVMSKVDDDLRAAMFGNIGSATRAANTNAASRGLLRSGVPQTAINDATRTAQADYTAGMRKARMDAIGANDTAKQQWWSAGRSIASEDQARADQQAAARAAQAGAAARQAAEEEANYIKLAGPDGTITKVPRDIYGQIMGME